MDMSKLSNKQLQQLVLELARENEEIKAKQAAKQVISFKIGDKGGVSLYGLNSRFPVTLYANQWIRLLDKADELRKFIEANKGKLSWK